MDKLQDTLAKLRLMADFKPLDSAEAYNFMNRYLLPGLDTLPTKRKIFIHPLTGRDFKKAYKRDEARLVAEFLKDTVKNDLFDQFSLATDGYYQWDSKKLVNTVVVDDTMRHLEMDELKAWHKKFGYGYICVSYPQYNAHTGRLFVKEWLQNMDMCGNGRSREVWYVKAGTDWKLTSIINE